MRSRAEESIWRSIGVGHSYGTNIALHSFARASAAPALRKSASGSRVDSWVAYPLVVIEFRIACLAFDDLVMLLRVAFGLRKSKALCATYFPDLGDSECDKLRKC